MCIFWKKAVKSPQRQGIRLRTLIGLRRLGGRGLWPPISRFVFKTKDFNTPYSSCFNPIAISLPYFTGGGLFAPLANNLRRACRKKYSVGVVVLILIFF